MHEDLDIINYANCPVHFQLEIALRSDFADIFEVRQHQLVRRGNTQTRWNEDRRELRTTYTNGEFHRGVLFQLLDSDSRPQFANGRVIFDVALEAGQSWHTCACYHLDAGGGLRSAHRCQRTDGTEHDELGTLHAEWKSVATRLSSANEDVYRAFTQSVEDMGAPTKPNLYLRSVCATPDGRIYFASSGKSYLIQAGPKYTLLAVNDLNDMPDYATPAVARGRIYIKGKYDNFSQSR